MFRCNLKINMSEPSQPALEQNHETPDNPEIIPQEVFVNLVNTVGNHEAKLIVTALITSQTDKWFSVTSLKNELIQRQGEHPGWVQSTRTPFSYCEASLAPIGAVIKGRIKSERKEVDAYKTSEVGEKWGLPFVGELLEWSLAHPDFSLQQVFGSTSTNQVKRSPETRYNIYEALLTQTSDAPAIKDIEVALSDQYPKRTVQKQLEALNGSGIVDLKTAYQRNFDPKIVIVEPNPPVKDVQRTPETELIYSAIKYLYEQGVVATSASQIYETCLALAPDTDPTTLGYAVSHGLHPNAPSFPGLKVTNREGIVTNKSVVSLSPEAKNAIEDLINRLEQLADSDNLTNSTAKATEIISNPDKVRALMEKARDFSSAYRGVEEGGTQDLLDRVSRIVSSLGQVSTNEVRNSLKDEGRPLSSERTSQILKALVKNGALSVSTAQSDRSKNTKVKVYTSVE
jgi:hypothetical protein